VAVREAWPALADGRSAGHRAAGTASKQGRATASAKAAVAERERSTAS
jgi:hypothetical protein